MCCILCASNNYDVEVQSYFCRKTITRKLFLKRKTSLKHPNKEPFETACYTVSNLTNPSNKWLYKSPFLILIATDVNLATVLTFVTAQFDFQNCLISITPNFPLWLAFMLKSYCNTIATCIEPTDKLYRYV